MPRRARKVSSSSIYHVVIKGIDRQIMFVNTNDYKKYLDILSFYKEECNFELYAYCLMSNHVHLLIKINECPLDTIFRKLNTHYAVWFNMKYQRTGHLQQDRFYSEPVENESYFIAAIKYIHNNPTKAGLEQSPGASYKWSSIHEYTNENYSLIDYASTFNMISSKDQILPSENDYNTDCLDIDKVQKRLPDDVATEIICDIAKCNTPLDLCRLDITTRNKYIRLCHKQGVSIRQINRLTGISRGIVQRTIMSGRQYKPSTN